MNPPKKLLIVEGVDDKHVVRHLQRRKLPEVQFEIEDKGNVDEVLKAIGLEIKVSDRIALGILVDTDNNLTDRWRSISDRLKNANIRAPKALPCAGAIIGKTPRVGVWASPIIDRLARSKISCRK